MYFDFPGDLKKNADFVLLARKSATHLAVRKTHTPTPRVKYLVNLWAPGTRILRLARHSPTRVSTRRALRARHIFYSRNMARHSARSLHPAINRETWRSARLAARRHVQPRHETPRQQTRKSPAKRPPLVMTRPQPKSGPCGTTLTTDCGGSTQNLVPAGLRQSPSPAERATPIVPESDGAA